MSIQSGIYLPPETGLPVLAVLIVDGEVVAKAVTTGAEAKRWIKQERAQLEYLRELDAHYGLRSAEAAVSPTASISASKLKPRRRG